MKLEKRINYNPKEKIDFVESFSFFSSEKNENYNPMNKIKKFPNMRERFRYEADIRGEYIPSKIKFIPQENFHPKLQERKEELGEESYSQNYDYLAPDVVFDDVYGNSKKVYIMNKRDAPVFVAKGNREEGSYKINDFKHIKQIPENIFNLNGFRESFYGDNPPLVFITENQYKIEKERTRIRKEKIRKEQEELKNRIDGRGGNFRERRDGSSSIESSYSENGKIEGEVVNGVYLYGNGAVSNNSSSSTEEIEFSADSSGKGLSEIIRMATGSSGEEGYDDETLSESSINELFQNGDE